MKGYPKILKTKSDFFNCLAMVQAGELEAEGLENALEALERRRYIACKVMGMSEDKKTATVMYCAEVKEGSAYKTDTGVSGTVAAATVQNGMTDEGDTLDTTEIVLDAEAGDAKVIYVLSPVDVLGNMDMTEDDISAIKGVLAQYE